MVRATPLDNDAPRLNRYSRPMLCEAQGGDGGKRAWVEDSPNLVRLPAMDSAEEAVRVWKALVAACHEEEPCQS